MLILNTLNMVQFKLFQKDDPLIVKFFCVIFFAWSLFAIVYSLLIMFEAVEPFFSKYLLDDLQSDRLNLAISITYDVMFVWVVSGALLIISNTFRIILSNSSKK